MLRSSPSRLLRLPAVGQLLICTDLHGNLKDFRRVRELFERRLEDGRDPFLLFTGDLIHGPACEPEEWPSYLGSYFVDESEQLVEEYIELEERHPGRVSCLLGNHEHSHVGGPHTPKFWPDETLHFEQTIGEQVARRFKKLFRSFPAVAVTRCGVAVTHAAPNATIDGPRDIEQLCYAGHEELPITSLDAMPVLGRLLWSRSCPAEVAQRFLRALSVEGFELGVVVYGHEIVSEGFCRISGEQLLVSTSFGVRDSKKVYVQLDLASRYNSTQDLRTGCEILPLYG